MTGVQTPSRLHFGLLDVTGSPQTRAYGGVGLMIESPGLRITTRPAPSWSASGPLAERALAFAKRCAESTPMPAQHLDIEQAPREHVGLGTGTQLGLAIALMLAREAGGQAGPAIELAHQVGRGSRSAIGLHGFERGGFLVDGGKRDVDSPGVLIGRYDFPSDWRLVLILPDARTGLHGEAEREVFDGLRADTRGRERSAELCRLVVMGMVPALIEQDERAFGEALCEFNLRAGEPFAAAQKGGHCRTGAAELIAYLRGEGVRGAGQSSWGPAVFAVTPDEEQAAFLAQRVRARWNLSSQEVWTSRACNRGARAFNPKSCA